MLLVWKHKIPKIMSEDQRQLAGMNDTGISWVKNMSAYDSNKWVAKHFPRAKRIEIQKRTGYVNLKIVISRSENHPKLSSWGYKPEGIPNDIVISIGQNGTSLWNLDDFDELHEAVLEGIEFLTRIEENKK